MKQITSDYKLQEAQKKLHERQSILKEFVDALNAERVGTKWKPLTGRAVAVKLAHLDMFDLYAFLKSCREGDSFGRRFFGFLKVKK